MAAKTVLNYIPKKSIIHELTGTTKLVIFLALSTVSIITFDIRVIVALLLFCFVSFAASKIKIKEIQFMLDFIYFFLVANFIMLFLFNPEKGPELYGSRTVLFHLFWRYDVTKEQMFYQLNVSSKYFIALPLAILFVSTTNPSELAASLNSVGIPYKISYAVCLALRYIPDILKDYHDISQAQQARGIELGKDVKFFVRLKNAVNIILPLVLVSIHRVDVISNAMDLRCFGKKEKRTWYMKMKFSKKDYIALAIGLGLTVISLVVTYSNGSRYYNPFVK